MIKSEVIMPLESQGLPVGVNMNLSGTADELTRTWHAMVINLLVAVCMVYLLMAILFENFIYPLVIIAFRSSSSGRRGNGLSCIKP